MPSVTCPHCGATFDPDLAALSPVARRILVDAPETFKRGKPEAIWALAYRIGYSTTHTRRGLRELCRAGYVSTVPFGRARVQYVGNPTLMLSSAVKRLVA